MSLPVKTTPFLFALGLLVFGAGCQGVKMKKELNVSYGEAAGQTLLLDVFQPAVPAAGPRGALVLVHGGAWSAGDKSEFAPMIPMLVKEGYVAFVVNYRLVTPDANHWPAQLDDTQRAVRWVRAHADRYGIDARRVGAIGGSAGGHIVACLGTSDTRDNSDAALAAYSSRVSCVVTLCGPVDLTEDLANKVKQGEWTNEQVRILLGGTPAEVPDIARSASPLLHVDARSAPAYIVQGKNDEIVPVDQAVRFDAALKKAGVDSWLLVHNGGHDLDDEAAFMKFVTDLPLFLKKHLSL